MEVKVTGFRSCLPRIRTLEPGDVFRLPNGECFYMKTAMIRGGEFGPVQGQNPKTTEVAIVHLVTGAVYWHNWNKEVAPFKAEVHLSKITLY